jgi:pullulanase
MARLNRCSQLSRLRAVVAPWAVAAVLLAGCATATGDGVDAGLPPPAPDANLADSPYGTGLYLRGTFNDFGTSSPLTYQGNNRYSAVVSLIAGAHELKVADAAYSPDTTFAVAVDRPAAIALGQPTALVLAAGNGNNMQLFVPETGTYRFEFSATDRTSPVLLIALVSRAPYQGALYVRGTFNAFDTSAPFPYQGSNRYLTSLGLEAGTYEFKIADESFSSDATFAVRADASAALLLDAPTSLVTAPGIGNNIILDIAQTGTYRFELIASAIEAPVLLVSLEQLAPYPVPIYLRGTFNDFDTSVLLRYRGESRYVATIGLDSGAHGFKIADLDFTAEYTFSVDATQPAAIALDRSTPLALAPGEGNEATLDVATTASFAFELTVTDPQAPLLRISRVASAPYPVDLFVVGSFNLFEPVSRLRYQGENRYAVTLALSAGQHRLKIADAGFSDGATFSVSASGEASIALDTPTVLEPATGTDNDTLLSIVQAGDYRFVLAADNPVAPVLRIARDTAP